MTRPRPHPRRRRASAGLTILELMIVIAIIGAGAYLLRAGLRAITKADLVEDATDLAAILRRTNQLAIEQGELHRVVIDLDMADSKSEQRIDYVVERCQGSAAIARNEAVRIDEETVKRAADRGRQKMNQLPPDALAVGDADEAMKRTLAVAGHHIADRTCTPAVEGFTGDANGKKWGRALRIKSGVRFKEIWVQHRDDRVTKGQVAIYFFPTGTATKSVIELTDGSEVFTILVHGLTGRVELRDGALSDPDDHMLRNVMGDKDAQRESDK
jgi:prepilin-type N-terminal cleavage/methylation domain-containing protein